MTGDLPTNSAEQPGPTQRFTLRITLVAAFCALALLMGMLMNFASTRMVREFVRDELRNGLAQSINIAASQVSVDLHHQLQRPEDEQSPAYRVVQKQLQTIRDRGRNIRFVYTMRRNPNGDIVFVVDAEEDPKEHSNLGDVYNEATPALLAALSAPAGSGPFVEQQFSKDEWGTWLSAFVPLYTSSGEPDGILGMDVSAASVVAHERQYLIVVWLVSAVVTLAILPLGLYFAGRIRRPLAALATEMERIGQFRLDSQETVTSRIKEIQEMGRQVGRMRSGLRSFSKYVPADLVRQLVNLGMDAQLGGTRRELTIMFTDIEDFTAISERLSPEQLLRYLGEYLDVVTSALLANGATVDKFLGDGVMAFWGAPLETSDHAARACRAALMLERAIDTLNERWRADGRGVAFRTRLGINTGEVIVGNVGSEARMSYTIIGDHANLASRIETANKYYGTRMLVSGATVAQIGDQFTVRQIDRVLVAGKREPVDLYELVGEPGSTTEALRHRCQVYDRGFQLYVQRRFPEAIAAFESLDGGMEPPALVLVARCRAYMDASPPPDWNGAFELPSK